VAAERAVQSPLLEDVHLSGARGVLVNITGNRSVKLKEINELMNTVRSFTAEDATIIFGSVLDENMGDALRVTVVATGLGGVPARQTKPQLEVVARTGTDDAPMLVSKDAAVTGAPNWAELDQPTAIRIRRSGGGVEPFARTSNFDALDIPAFLRKQAD
jgi:cell division protein FtsZ